MKTDTITETITDGIEFIDEFLAAHGPYLPDHLVDFALDCRSIIRRLEEELEEASRVRVA